MAIVPRPGIVADLARDGSLKTLDDLGLDADEINGNYSDAWTKLTTVDDDTYGIVAKANSKSTVWYDPRVKDEPPKDWDGAARPDAEAEGRGQDTVGRRRRRRLAAHRLVREHLPLPVLVRRSTTSSSPASCHLTTSRSRMRSSSSPRS